MPTFVFKGRNRFNEMISGERMAPSRGALEMMLRREQIILASAREKGKTIALPKLSGGGKKVPDKDLAIFTRQFSIMIDAGLPLVQCLELLGQQQENKTFKSTLLQVRADVEAGMTLSDSAAKHPKAFEALYVNMLAAGEAAGILDIVLQRLSVYIEKMVKLKSDVKSAMIYPVSVIVISIGVISVIMIWVIPSFRKIFESMVGPGEALPLPTEIVVAISGFMASYWWLIALVAGASVVAIKSYYKTDNGRRVLDTLMLKAPILGDLMKKIAIARFSRTLATMLSSGVPILESLDITYRTAGNVVIMEAVRKIRVAIERGQTMFEPLKASAIFPAMVAQMIGVGEQTGAMDAMLSKIADFYEQEVDTAVKSMLTMLEPAMIGFLGITIGSIVIAMYLPLFKLISKLASH
jgi:type IV pilus assembly protein PilC